MADDIVTTITELEALPPGSIVMSAAGRIACRFGATKFVQFGDERAFESWSNLTLPARVLLRFDPDPYVCQSCGETTVMRPHRADCPEVLNGTAHPDTLPDARPPRRIRMSRQRPWRAEHPDAVIVARPSKWGNPFKVGGIAQVESDWRASRATFEYDMTAALAVELYRQRFAHDARQIRAELAGRDLACWCPLDQPCHADVLLELANQTGSAS